jgi:spore coat protein U-like protein
MVRSWTLASCVAAVLFFQAPASATCRVENVTPLTFGQYTSGSAMHVDSVGQLDVSCTAMTQVRIHMGRGASGRLSPRAMRGARGTLAYGLFLDAAHTAAWGDGSEGTVPFSTVVPAGQVSRIPVFARIFGRQGVPAGQYVDQITVTIIF